MGITSKAGILLRHKPVADTIVRAVLDTDDQKSVKVSIVPLDLLSDLDLLAEDPPLLSLLFLFLFLYPELEPELDFLELEEPEYLLYLLGDLDRDRERGERSRYRPLRLDLL